MTAPLLQIRELDVCYGRTQVLHDIALEIDRSGIAAVLGANGAGKSTLLRSISGLVRSRSGQIVLKGRSISDASVHDIVRRGVLHVPEGRAVLAELTIMENLRLGGYIHGRLRSADLDRIFSLFPVLKARAKQAAGTLSGGEQQMLSIARSILGRPELLMIDELSLGLSPKVTREIMDRLVKIREEGIALLIVEQNIGEACRIADRIYLLSHGRIAFAGAPAEFLTNEDVRSIYFGMRDRNAHD